MGEFHFILENSNRDKLRTLIIGLLVIIVLLGSFIAVVLTFDSISERLPRVGSVRGILISEVYSFSTVGLFYSGFSGGLFFLPIPQEIFYYYGLLRGNSILLSFLTVNAGYMLAQGVNYFIGVRLNRFFMLLISKKRFYKARRYIGKYGAKGIFVFNFLPFPAPLLTFALGVARYNVYRLYFFTLLGIVCKYAVIIGFFFLVT